MGGCMRGEGGGTKGVEMEEGRTNHGKWGMECGSKR